MVVASFLRVVCGEGADVASAYLAAGCPCRGSNGGFSDLGWCIAEDGRIWLPAFLAADVAGCLGVFHTAGLHLERHRCDLHIFGRSGSEVQGKEAIRELIRKRWVEESTPRRHMVSNIRLSEPGPDGAIQGKAMFIVTIATTGESRARILATGWYEDVYVNTPGGWKFANRINYVDPRGRA